eukprot:scaffold112160_cov38-Prasinocladus_malaysianus.AAC.1
MAGQVHHFAPLVSASGGAEATYALERFDKEVQRLYAVMDAWLDSHPYFAGDEYSIADIAIFAWVWRAQRHRVDLDDYPHVEAWYNSVLQRPAVKRGLAIPKSDG